MVTSDNARKLPASSQRLRHPYVWGRSAAAQQRWYNCFSAYIGGFRYVDRYSDGYAYPPTRAELAEAIKKADRAYSYSVKVIGRREGNDPNTFLLSGRVW